VVEPELLELCVEVLDQHPSVLLAYPQNHLIDGDSRTIGDYVENLHLMDERPRALHRGDVLLAALQPARRLYASRNTRPGRLNSEL